MRKTNWRLVIVGLVLVVLAAVFFVGMMTMTSRSNDPVALMQTVGTVSGVVGALGLVMALFGFRGTLKGTG
jgi:flagellar motor component MotA